MAIERTLSASGAVEIEGRRRTMPDLVEALASSLTTRTLPDLVEALVSSCTSQRPVADAKDSRQHGR